MGVVLLRGDARQLPLPDGCADLVACSPPYFNQRDYRDGGMSLAAQIGNEETPAEYIARLVAVMAECVRVLKPGGSIFFNLGDKFSQRVQVRRSSHQPGIFPGKFEEFGQSWAERAARGATRMPHQNVIDSAGRYVAEKSLMGLPWRFAFACMDDLGLILRRDIIWSKTSAIPESVQDRCATRHEYLFHFTKQPRYFAAVDEIREPHKMRPQRRPNGHKQRQQLGVLPAQTYSTSQRDELGVDGHPLGALPGSVWEINAAPLAVPDHIAHATCCGGQPREGCEDGLAHHAAWPPALIRKIILGWSSSAICCECGEGRFPVTSSERVRLRERDQVGRARLNSEPVHGMDQRAGTHVIKRSAILGYACACTPRTDHPGSAGRERSGQSYARETGRDAHPHGGVSMLPRTGPWREYHLDGWTPPPSRPSVVVDPFGGTGTTAMVADLLGRIGISIDRSADYCRLATWRVNDPAERARALGVPKPPPVPAGQLNMFDLNGEAS